MGTPEFFAGADVWTCLKDLGRTGRKRRKRVATAYLGDGAGASLGLGKGDVLLVALSEQNAKLGAVSPHEIHRLREGGVEVFIDERLHAKVYIMGGALAVGSPNLSMRSQSVLHETLLVTRDAKALVAATSWFDSLCVAPVTPQWLAHCAKLYRPPTIKTTREEGASRPRTWLVGVNDMVFPADELDECEAGRVDAASLVEDGGYVEPVRFLDGSRFFREVRVGDMVIECWETGVRREVYPPARVLSMRKSKTARGASVVYLYLELPEGAAAIAWSTFRRGMLDVGLRLGKSVTTRELRGEAIIARAKQLVALHR